MSIVKSEEIIFPPIFPHSAIIFYIFKFELDYDIAIGYRTKE